MNEGVNDALCNVSEQVMMMICHYGDTGLITGENSLFTSDMKINMTSPPKYNSSSEKKN